ncbi:MAG TPA: sugar ABC transporter substrate-binding protein [Gaiellaceae bacterium]|jgi:ABC-type sugar transport system substrate-binding protein|nr:sugar ABC transporter substrate-binding protein [Gaiellaceae bacterium]
MATVVAFAAALALAAAGTSATRSVTSTSKALGKTVYYLGCDASNPFCAAYNKTMEAALKGRGYSVTSLYNKFDPATQAQQMAQATAQKPAAIVVFVADSTAIIPSLARAYAKKIPVVVVGSLVASAGLKYIAVANLQNSTALGTYAGMNLVEGMKKQGLAKGNVIALTGTSSQIDVQQRMAGFKGYLAKYPQFKLVESQDAGWDPIKSATLAKTLYAKYASRGGIQGAYGMADYMATAAATAAKSAGFKVGLPKGIVFTGSNCSSAGVTAIKSGQLYGDATQSPKVEAAAAARDALAVLSGKKFANKIVLNPEARFTKANLAKYAAQCTY